MLQQAVDQLAVLQLLARDRNDAVSEGVVFHVQESTTIGTCCQLLDCWANSCRNRISFASA